MCLILMPFLYVAAGLTLAPLVVKVDPNLNVVLTACITVFVGCYRSVKPTAPTVSTSVLRACLDKHKHFCISYIGELMKIS